MQLFVGLSSHRGSIKRFGFDLLEMPVSSSLPKVKTLRELRAQRPNLKFSLRVHPDSLQVGADHPDIAKTAAAADALNAAVIVLATGPRFSPIRRNIETLRKIVAELSAEGREIAWEPRGVWAPEESEKLAAELGVLLVRDLTREAAPALATTIYTRLLPFGTGARVSQNSIETLAQHLEVADVAYVVVQGDGAKMTRSQLKNWFDELDEEFDDSSEDELIESSTEEES